MPVFLLLCREMYKLTMKFTMIQHHCHTSCYRSHANYSKTCNSILCSVHTVGLQCRGSVVCLTEETYLML